jgi:hypothetical protein
MGFPLSISTNSPCILAAADESWRVFPRRFDTAPMRIRIGVTGAAVSLPQPAVLAQGNLISFIGDSQNFTIGDLDTGFGYGWLTRELAQRQDLLRYHYLDSLVLTLIDALHVSSIHAACVVLDGQGVLLCGASEAGKSSLAYACARQGWGYVCDDCTSLLRHRTDRTVIGNPYRLRLRPDAYRLFPEFKEKLTITRPNGKMSIEIATSQETRIKQVPECQVRHVVFLERQEHGIASPISFPRERALSELSSTIAMGPPEYRRNRIEQYRHLLEVNVVRLRYSDLDAAVECLANVVRSRN